MSGIETKPMVYVHDEGPVQLIVLNRAEKKNALTPEMLDLLVQSIEVVSRQSTCRAIVLCGEGNVFCSGFDMKRVHDDAAALPSLLTGLSRSIRLLRRTPMPVIVAAHGAAVAGGCAFLGGGDFIVTNREAKLGYPVTRLGLSPAVTTPALSQSLSYGRTRERTLDPDLISGEEAARIGLASVCVDIVEDVLPRAERIARQLAEKPAYAIAATKNLLNEFDGSLAEDRFELALHASLDIAGNSEQLTRVAALWK